MALTKGVHHVAIKAKGLAAFEKLMHFYTEILGSYTDENGTVIAKTIPQPVLEANPYDSNAGHIYRIYVK